jgi:ubiquinone/menaquinone biosynthesis C-methylase UbiE
VEVFERAAGRYDAWFESARGRAIFESEVRCLGQLSAGLPHPWLEVGVGTGRFAGALGIEVGIDPAVAALHYARGRGLRVAGALGQALPLRDGQFGGVFVIVTVCFADDPLGLLQEARRVVARSGAVVLGIVPAGSPWGRSYAAKGRGGHLFYSCARFFSLSELQGLAYAAGLRFERAASTLFQPPGARRLRIEGPKHGFLPGAGFVSLLYRPLANRGKRRGPGRT